MSSGEAKASEFLRLCYDAVGIKLRPPTLQAGRSNHKAEGSRAILVLPLESTIKRIQVKYCTFQKQTKAKDQLYFLIRN